jgi:hypothetical protein
MTTHKLTFFGAMDLMRRRDARLIQTNIKDRCEHWIVPGGRITLEVAAKIKSHPQGQGRKGWHVSWSRSDMADRGRVMTAPLKEFGA